MEVNGTHMAKVSFTYQRANGNDTVGDGYVILDPSIIGKFKRRW